MKRKHKVAIVTGSRAEYGLLRRLMGLIKEDKMMELQLLVTGGHLSGAFGQTSREIEKDGFKINAKIPLEDTGDGFLPVARSVGFLTTKFSEILDRLRPDLLVVLGDRYEIFAAAQAAFLLKIPIAHIIGGDTTEGAFDESLRHAITKMAHLHFVTHDAAANRLLQLGEDERYIYNFGSPAIDEIHGMRRMSRRALEKELKFKFQTKNLLVTFHPETLSEDPLGQLKELLSALSEIGEDVGLIFTKANADPKGRAINRMIETYVKSRPHARVYASLGTHLYLNTLSQVDAVVGNSSSGVYEAPSFKIPTVNIGDRQKGRFLSSSVISCPARKDAILKAIQQAFDMDYSQVTNPYGRGDASIRIYRKIKSIEEPKRLLMKHFYTHAIIPRPGKVFVIAEAGVNHNGSLKLAKQLVDAAVEAGADAVKFQSFKADRLAVKSAEKAVYQKSSTGSNESQWSMLRKLELDEKSHQELRLYCQKRKIEFLSTPFDEESLNFLVRHVGIKKIKVASGEITNAPLLLKMAKTGLPLIISTGMTYLDEIEQALSVIAFGRLYSQREPQSHALFQEAFDSQKGKEILREKVTLLHCTSEYPAPYHDANLLAMDTLFQKFHLPVGLSDHTPGIAVAIAAAARGACIIEKHLTLDKTMPGPDHQSSLEPSSFKELVFSLRALEQAWGSGQKIPAASEIKNIPIVRKALVAQKHIQKGDRFTNSNLTAKRVKEGTPPIYYWDLLGKTAVKNYRPDEVVHCE